MSTPWDPDGHDDAHHDGVSDLPEESTSWPSDWSAHDPAHDSTDPADLPGEPADGGAADLPAEAGHGADPATWSGPSDGPDGSGSAGIGLLDGPGSAGVGVSDGHGGLPDEQPADWSGDADPSAEEPQHADWSGIVDPDGSDDPDPTDPAGWGAPAEDPFPPALSLDVDPADGGPWADPDLLGADPGEDPRTDPPLALLSDLAAADGGDPSDWAGVESSDDPAIRSLAAYWRTAV